MLATSCRTCAARSAARVDGRPDRSPGRLRCPRGHSFDVARQGYVNLPPAGRPTRRRHRRDGGRPGRRAGRRRARLLADALVAAVDSRRPAGAGGGRRRRHRTPPRRRARRAAGHGRAGPGRLEAGAAPGRPGPSPRRRGALRRLAPAAAWPTAGAAWCSTCSPRATAPSSAGCCARTARCWWSPRRGPPGRAGRRAGAAAGGPGEAGPGRGRPHPWFRAEAERRPTPGRCGSTTRTARLLIGMGPSARHVDAGDLRRAACPTASRSPPRYASTPLPPTDTQAAGATRRAQVDRSISSQPRGGSW